MAGGALHTAQPTDHAMANSKFGQRTCRSSSSMMAGGACTSSFTRAKMSSSLMDCWERGVTGARIHSNQWLARGACLPTSARMPPPLMGWLQDA